MVSVTQRIAEIKQPRGGYLPMSGFEVINLNDGVILNEENVSGSTMGMVVDYLTRWAQSKDVEDAFQVSILGARRVDREAEAMRLLSGIKDMSDASIVNACKLVGFDTYARGVFVDYDSSTVNPDHPTCQNIRTLVNRVLSFFNSYGPVTLEGFDLMGGYSRVVDRGSGDFLTKNVLWDLKVMRKDPESKHSLQLLMYYIMGKRSIHKEFDSITKVGFYNPRLNKIYLMDMSKVDPQIIKTVEDEVICYTGEESGLGNQLKTMVESLIPGNSPSDYPAFDERLLALYFDYSDKLIPEAKARLQQNPNDLTANFILLKDLLPCDENKLDAQLIKTMDCAPSSEALEQLLDLIGTEYESLVEKSISDAEYSDNLASLPSHLEYKFRGYPTNTEGYSPLLTLADVLLQWDAEKCSCPEILSNLIFDVMMDVYMMVLDIKFTVEWVHRAVELCRKLADIYDFDNSKTDLYPPHLAVEFLGMHEAGMIKAIESHSEAEYQKAIDFYLGEDPIMAYIPEKLHLKTYCDAKNSRFMSESKMKKCQKEIDKHWDDYFNVPDKK